jgi:tripartite-type tricarboxylate transporter receptor subunit TctC
MAKRRVLQNGFILLRWVLLFVAATQAAAESYPSKPVRVIVAQIAGGASDLLVRPLAQKLTDLLGQQFVIDNRPGAGANIGAELASKATPDGYTLLMVSAPHAVAPSLYKKLGYSLMRDFTPISLMASQPLCMVVHPSVPVKSIAELVAYAKQRPNKLSYASTGYGAINHLAAELFKSKAGITMLHVPYKGSSAALPDVLNGTVPVYFANIGPLKGHIDQGRLRPLGVTSAQRVRIMPQVPTIAESGYPGYEAINWFGMVAPTGTPAAVVRRLNEAMRQAVASPELTRYYESRAAQPITDSPAEMRVFLASEIKKWAEVVKRAGAHVD